MDSQSPTKDQTQKQRGRPVCPPKEFEFSTMLIREFLLYMEREGYTKKAAGTVHRAVFGRYLRRLVDCLDPERLIDFDAFGGKKIWLKWEDIRPAVIGNALKPVKLTNVERMMLTLEDASSSWCAVVYAALMFVAIIASVALIIVQSMPSVCPKEDCFSTLKTVTVLAFSFDYFTRLACSPCSRIVITDRDMHLREAVPEALGSSALGRVQQTTCERFMRFFLKPMNLIDLLAILPFWLTLLVGNLLPFPLSFLRALRLLRFLRIMKIGKFDSTLSVLGTTLANSTQSVQVLLIYVGLTSLVAGAILNQTELPKGAFQNVPNSAWYVFARMMGMRHSVPWVKGNPGTIIGGVVMFVCLIFKGIIWILPFGQIGQTFKETWSKNQEMQKIRREVEVEDTRSPERVWIEDGSSPVASLDVWEIAGETKHGNLAGMGRVPLPVLTNKASSAVVSVPLCDGSMRPWFGTPTVDLKISWRPSEVKDGNSKGTLHVDPIMGKDFQGSPSARWSCTLRLPTSLYGEDVEHEWESNLSTTGTTPAWDGPGGVFEIKWEGREKKGDAGGKSEAAPSDHEILQKVMTLLEKQGRQIQELSRSNAGLDQATSKIAAVVQNSL